MKDKLIVIAGPTAAGKTALSVELAKKINEAGGDATLDIERDGWHVYQ